MKNTERQQLFFEKLITHNKDNDWINPVFEANGGFLYSNFFQIVLDDFFQIVETEKIKVYRIIKKENKYTLYCKIEDEQRY